MLFSTNRFKYIISFIIFIIVISFGIYIRHRSGLYWEYSIMASFQKINGIPYYLLLLFTKLGNPVSYFIMFPIIFAYGAYTRNIKDCIRLLIVVLIALAISNMIKYGVQRIRPLEFFRIQQGGFSYPSAHASVSGAFYWKIRELLMDCKKKSVVYNSVAIIPVIIGISRLAVGVHWPSDVILGFFVAYLSLNVSSILETKFINE